MLWRGYGPCRAVLQQGEQATKFSPAHRMGAPERRLRALPDHSACVNPFAHMRKHVDVRNMFASPGIMRLSEPEVTGVCQN